MKKILAIALMASVMIMTGCKKDGGDDKSTTCAKPDVTIYTDLPGQAIVYMEGTDNAGFYEMEYGANGFDQGSGTSLNGASGTNITNLNNGTYDIYTRANCGGSDYSEWVLKSFIITGGGSSSCNAPYDLHAYWNGTEYLLNWSASAGTGGTLPGYYQVEYGITGFTKGTGTVSNAASNYFSGNFTQGQTYDYYVRSNCGGSDFSSWTGPASFYVEY